LKPKQRQGVAVPSPSNFETTLTPDLQAGAEAFGEHTRTTEVAFISTARRGMPALAQYDQPSIYSGLREEATTDKV
jgi:hypothetical protein